MGYGHYRSSPFPNLQRRPNVGSRSRQPRREDDHVLPLLGARFHARAHSDYYSRW